MAKPLEYDRAAAVTYARTFASVPVSDGFVVLDATRLLACLPPERRQGPRPDPFIPVPSGTRFIRRGSGPTMSEDAVTPSGAVLVGAGCMDDAAHFVSCCIGTPPRGSGGGFEVPSDRRVPRAPYGALTVTDLVHALEGEPRITVATRASKDRTLPPHVLPGDVIVYTKDGHFTGTAVFVTADAIVTHSVSRTPDDITVTSRWDWVADLDPAARWTIYHFPSAVKPLAVASGPFPARYLLPIQPFNSIALQTKMTAAMSSVTAAAHTVHARAENTIGAALVDITDPAAPAFAQFHGDETMNIGSMGKIAALYAAHELRFRLQKVVDQARADGLDSTRPGWEAPVLQAVRDVWGPQLTRGFAHYDTTMPQRFPKLEKIFTFTPAGQVEFRHGDDPGAVKRIGEFKRPTRDMRFADWMTSTILYSNNYAAGLMIDAIDYPYINSALREGGFWDPPTQNGLWLSADYDGRDWKPGIDPVPLSPRGKFHYKATSNIVGTATQCARLLTLAALGKLFDGDLVTCGDMLNVMRKRVDPDANTSFIVDALNDAQPPITVQEVQSKIGIGVVSPSVPGLKGIHDCAVIKRVTPPPTNTVLRYVAVVTGGYDRGFDAGVFDRAAQALDDCVATSH